jgi:probable rRNA maturation factor
MTERLDFVTEHDGWAALTGLEARARDAAAVALAAFEAPRTGQAVVLLSGDETLHALNARFRGKDSPTNVLSFPAPASEGYPGDLALSYDTCAAEAARDGKSVEDHAVHLVLHGLLHLNGLDHIKEDEAAEMEALERAALASVGIADPYLVRTEP